MSKLKCKGGYNIAIAGRPAATIKTPAEPRVLYIPLKSRRFNFTDICIENGWPAAAGDILAIDPDNYYIPLLAPRSGTPKLDVQPGHIVMEDISTTAARSISDAKNVPHIMPEIGANDKRRKMLRLGAWQYLSDTFTGDLPDPEGTPQAIIVSTLSLEPFVARGDAQLKGNLPNFTRALEHLQSLLQYQPIYLVLPDITSPFATKVRNQIRGYAWAKLVEVPLRYGLDHPRVLTRNLGLKESNGPVWLVKVEGMLAIDRALTLSEACLTRTISVGGPAAKEPAHLEVTAGLAIADILTDHSHTDRDIRVINGGMLTGTVIGDQLGLDVESCGLTLIGEPTKREFLAFARPGLDRRSYSGCFLSSLRRPFGERVTTALRGEERPCVSCGFCHEVCPARILPHMLHKYLYQDLIEDAAAARVDLCVQCGLCSYVCPSKLELKEQFAAAIDRIEEEKIQLQQDLENMENTVA